MTDDARTVRAIIADTLARWQATHPAPVTDWAGLTNALLAALRAEGYPLTPAVLAQLAGAEPGPALRMAA